MTNNSKLHCGTFYIMAGIMAFFGTTMPLLDMKKMFPDIYLSEWTLYLMWILIFFIIVIGFINIYRKSGELLPVWFITSSFAGIILTIVSIIAETRLTAVAEKGIMGVGIGGLMLLTAFIGTMFFTIFRIIKKARDKTYKKRIMGNLLDSTAAESLGSGTYWIHKHSLKTMQNSKPLPEM